MVEIFESFGLDVAKVKLSEVTDGFEKYFAPKKNISLERNKFLSRRQEPGKPLEMLGTNLKNMSSMCELGMLEEGLVKDMFILGSLEEFTYIKERLLEVEDGKTVDDILELAKTIQMSCASCSTVASVDMFPVYKKGFPLANSTMEVQGHNSMRGVKYMDRSTDISVQLHKHSV